MPSASYTPAPNETMPVREGAVLGATADMAAIRKLPTEGAPAGDLVGADTEPQGLDDATALQRAREAEQVNEQAFSRRSPGWTRAYRAYRNQHFAGSKYLSKEFESRSKLFVPKTRAAVRKNQTAFVAALFSTKDAVAITAEHDDDERQRATAELVHQLLNYRLDRTSPRGGIPWFTIAVGAHQDAQQAGIICSKQHWDYMEKTVGQEPVMVPTLGPDGAPATGPDGQPAMQPAMDETGQPMMQPITKKVRDRPMITLYPPENVIVDPAAPWFEPAQSGEYIILRDPVTLGSVKRMMRMNAKSNIKWRQVDDATLTRATSLYDTKGIRNAREGGGDRMGEPRNRKTSDASVCWLHENFFRHEGEDYHFYSVGSEAILSDPTPVENVYPANKGARPVVYGYGAIEAHNTTPMSPVESWQPLQQEINDTRNLRLDASKQAVLPFATIKAGKQVDVSVLTRLAPGAHIYVKDHDDIQFRELPAGVAPMMAEANNLNVDLDEQSGSFSGSSVATNRQLNETVGGLQLLSGSASAATEFDLRIVVETWVEPVLRQLVHLEQFYEDDEVVIGIAAERAKLWQKYGIDQVTDDLLTNEVSTRVDVGQGSTDPAQRMAKLSMVMTMLQGILPVSEPKVVPNSEEVIDEIFGIAGYRDGKRFFHFPDPNAPPQPPPPDPAMAKVQADAVLAMDKLRADMQYNQVKLAADAAATRAKMAADAALAQAKQASDAALAASKQRSDAEMVAAKQQQDAGLAAAKHQSDTAIAADKLRNDAALAERQHQLARDTADRSHALALETSRRSHSLAVASHNKTMLDEVSPPDGAGGGSDTTGQGAEGKTALQSIMDGLGTVIATVLQGQHEMMRALMDEQQAARDAQQAESERIAQLLNALAAPRRLVRGPDGRASSVEIVQ